GDAPGCLVPTRDAHKGCTKISGLVGPPLQRGKLVGDGGSKGRQQRSQPACTLHHLLQVLADVFTSGEGLAGGCTPYIFDGGGIPLPEQVVFPS
ncbi:hypothetical protein HaLaN_04011, partial [Haematococcus lacustris]